MVLVPFFPDRKNLLFQPLLLFAAVFAGLWLLVRWNGSRFREAVGVFRDWLPLGLTITAFWEMELFLPGSFNHHYEAVWANQDHVLLTKWGLRAGIEALGKPGPLLLELSYLFTYALGPFCLAALYFCRETRKIDRFLVIYLAGTLGAYALFPYFPSQPPRIVFPLLDLPSVTTWVRELNLFVLCKGTIHVGVFPSAHVSSAFAACWGMFLLGLRKVGWGLLLYACLVSVATVYGRYHYAADVAAGFAISLLAGAIGLLIRRFGQGSEEINAL